MGTKAINKNGTITVYNGVPNTLRTSQGTVLNAPALSDAQLKAHGLFDVVLPDGYDSKVHDLSDIFWDSANTQFTYTKSNKTFSQTVSELKQQKIANLKANANSKLSETDWYIVRNAEDSTKAIPSDVTTDRAAIRTSVETKETAINALTTKAAVIKYDISLD